MDCFVVKVEDQRLARSEVCGSETNRLDMQWSTIGLRKSRIGIFTSPRCKCAGHVRFVYTGFFAWDLGRPRPMHGVDGHLDIRAISRALVFDIILIRLVRKLI